MLLLLLQTTMDEVSTGLAGVALQSYVLAQPTLAARWQVERLEVHYPTPWWHAPPFGDDVLQEVLRRQPDVLGLSLTCWDADAQLDLAQRVRALRPDVRIVAGGPSASSRGPDLMRGHLALDALVRGEGEHALAALLGGRWGEGLSEVPGLSWRLADGTLHTNPGVGRGLPFSELPSPLVSQVYAPRWVANLEFARGCAQRCRFCDWRRYRAGVRRAAPERMRSDLERVVALGVPTTCVLDSALNADTDHLAALVAAVEQADPRRTLALRGFVRAPDLDARQLGLLGRLPLQGVEVSLNSTNAEALLRAGRQAFDPERFARSVASLARRRPFNLHLILGMPGDDLRGFGRTLAFVDRLLERYGPAQLPVVTVFWMIVEQGSYFWRTRAELGLSVRSTGVPYVLASGTFPKRDLIRALDEIQEQRHAARFRLDGPRELLEGALDRRLLVAPVPP